MTTKHTPGPWVTQPIDGAFEIRDGRGWVLAQRGPWPINAEESAANARLIAAAPDLEDALRDLADAARSACDARKHTALTEALFNADAALAKAGA